MTHKTKELIEPEILTEENFYKLLGVDKHHAIAVTVWDTLKHHNYSIVLKDNEAQPEIWKEVYKTISDYEKDINSKGWFYYLEQLQSKFTISKK